MISLAARRGEFLDARQRDDRSHVGESAHPRGRPRVTFVSFCYPHHSLHSGYSKIAEHGPDHFGEARCDVMEVKASLLQKLVSDELLRRIAKGTPEYWRAELSAELRVAKRMLAEPRRIYHFIYGESTYHYAGLLNGLRRNRVVATYHRPDIEIRKAIQVDWPLGRLSAVVCVGRSQMEFFQRLMDPERVFFVPHGIDTDFFRPPDSFEERDPNLCLIVGENYRDYEALGRLIDIVAAKRPATRFVAVASPQYSKAAGTHPNFTFLSQIPEAELLRLYRTAALMIQPLREATANNAVLESMACGLPLVISDVGSVRDYMKANCGVLARPGDANGMARAVLDLLEDPKARAEMAVNCRQQALEFSWPRVMTQLESVYLSIA